jgi:hypothetical protein
MKTTVFWDVAPFSVIEADRHFTGACRLRNRGPPPPRESEILPEFLYHVSSTSRPGPAVQASRTKWWQFLCNFPNSSAFCANSGLYERWPVDDAELCIKINLRN